MMAEYIERDPIIQFITNGLNKKRFGFDAIEILTEIQYAPAADVVPVKHAQCPVCSGQEVLSQDCYNGYSIEIDAEQREMTTWQGDVCLATFSIDYCPNCGAAMSKDGK